jgi:hypothetical protein
MQKKQRKAVVNLAETRRSLGETRRRLVVKNWIMTITIYGQAGETLGSLTTVVDSYNDPVGLRALLVAADPQGVGQTLGTISFSIVTFPAFPAEAPGDDDDDDGLSDGAIAGIVIGSVFGFACIVGGGFLLYKKGLSPKGGVAPDY